MPKTLLIVDDEKEISDLLKLYVQSESPNAVVLTALSLTSAKKFFQDKLEEINYVLCDYKLPDGTGIDLFNFLGSKWATRFVLMSGFLEETTLLGDKYKGLRYLLKPFDFDTLKIIFPELF